MGFDVITARGRIGLASTDASKDAVLTVSMNAALSLAEKYCSRRFAYQNESVELYEFYGDLAQLFRYPISSVSKVAVDGLDTDTYHVHNDIGAIVFDKIVRAHLLTIDYAGGFVTLPADLELSLWLIFDNLYPSFSGGASAVATGGISRITVPDVGSISFDTSGSSSAASGGIGLIPETAVGILEFYRVQSC